LADSRNKKKGPRLHRAFLLYWQFAGARSVLILGGGLPHRRGRILGGLRTLTAHRTAQELGLLMMLGRALG